jgi:hypothetical protein
MRTISIRLPEDVIEDLKLLAPLLGFSGYQPLIRAYVGQGMRKDLPRLEPSRMNEVAERLRRYGVDEDVIADALAAGEREDAAEAKGRKRSPRRPGSPES